MYHIDSSRTECDPMGEVSLPDHVYYGAHTARAVDNFRISNSPIAEMPELIEAFATVKQAAAQPLSNRLLRKPTCRSGYSIPALRMRSSMHAGKSARANTATTSSSTSCRAARVRPPT